MKYIKTFETYTNQNYPDLYNGFLGDEPIVAIPIDYYIYPDSAEENDGKDDKSPNDTNVRDMVTKSKYRKGKAKISPE